MTETPMAGKLDTDWLQEVYVSSENYYADVPRAELRAKFDRWLAEERAKVWDEAIDAQHETDRDWESYISSHDERPKPPKKALNPYRKETP